jgi:hypothetical protein
MDLSDEQKDIFSEALNAFPPSIRRLGVHTSSCVVPTAPDVTPDAGQSAITPPPSAVCADHVSGYVYSEPAAASWRAASMGRHGGAVQAESTV